MDHHQAEAVEQHDAGQQQRISVGRDPADDEVRDQAGDQRHRAEDQQPVVDAAVASALYCAFSRDDDDHGEHEQDQLGVAPRRHLFGGLSAHDVRQVTPGCGVAGGRSVGVTVGVVDDVPVPVPVPDADPVPDGVPLGVGDPVTGRRGGHGCRGDRCRRRRWTRAQRQPLLTEPSDDRGRIALAAGGEPGPQLGLRGRREIGDLQVDVLAHAEELQRPERRVDPLEDRDLVAVGPDEVLLLGPVVGAETGQHRERDEPGRQQRSAGQSPSAPARRGGNRGRTRDRGRSFGRAVVAGRSRAADVDERAADDRQVVAVAGPVEIDHIGDDAGHVVGAASAQRQFDQPVGALLRFALGEGLEQGLGRHDVGEPVGAQQVAVAGPGLADRHVRLDRRAGQRAQDHRLTGMVRRFIRSQPTSVDQGLHVGVVVRYL